MLVLYDRNYEGLGYFIAAWQLSSGSMGYTVKPRIFLEWPTKVATEYFFSNSYHISLSNIPGFYFFPSNLNPAFNQGKPLFKTKFLYFQ